MSATLTVPWAPQPISAQVVYCSGPAPRPVSVALAAQPLQVTIQQCGAVLAGAVVLRLDLYRGKSEMCRVYASGCTVELQEHMARQLVQRHRAPIP